MPAPSSPLTATRSSDSRADRLRLRLFALEVGELCNDGNRVAVACAYGLTSCIVCDANCAPVSGAASYCGDTVTDALAGEDCDDGNTATERCSYGLKMCTVCDANSKSVAGAVSFCGDAIVDPIAAAGGIRVDSSWIPGAPSKNLEFSLAFTNLRSCMR